MGYKVLGFVVWQGGKWYVRKRYSGTAGKAALAGIGAAVIAGVVVRRPAGEQVGRRSRSRLPARLRGGGRAGID